MAKEENKQGTVAEVTATDAANIGAQVNGVKATEDMLAEIARLIATGQGEQAYKKMGEMRTQFAPVKKEMAVAREKQADENRKILNEPAAKFYNQLVSFLADKNLGAVLIEIRVGYTGEMAEMNGPRVIPASASAKPERKATVGHKRSGVFTSTEAGVKTGPFDSAKDACEANGWETKKPRPNWTPDQGEDKRYYNLNTIGILNTHGLWTPDAEEAAPAATPAA